MRIIEVGPRDGLQNEKVSIPVEVKARFVDALAEAGLREIEITSFVSPKWVPQLADGPELLRLVPEGVLASALVPNARGLEGALASGIDRIAVFTAASTAFTEKNIGMTVEQSLEGFARLIPDFRAAHPSGWVRGYVSTVFECPYAGRISPDAVVLVVEKLLEMGVDEISLGDTIGVAVPTEVRGLIAALTHIPKENVAWHFHDTRGTAVANVAAALDAGYTAFDSSAGGLGGCPYAPGAGGNLATEDLIYFMERLGLATGIDPVRLAQASLEILALLGRSPSSRAQVATLAACRPD